MDDQIRNVNVSSQSSNSSETNPGQTRALDETKDEAKDEAKNQHSSQLCRKIQSAGRGLPLKTLLPSLKGCYFAMFTTDDWDDNDGWAHCQDVLFTHLSSKRVPLHHVTRLCMAIILREHLTPTA